MLDKIKLRSRKADSSDIDLMKKWLKNGEFMMNLYLVPKDDDRALGQKVLSMLADGSKDLSDKRYFIVESERPVGMIMFHDIEWRNRNLYMDILVGDDELKNKIWGLALFAEALRISFEIFNMHKVSGMIYGFNENSRKLVEAFGGIKEGTFKRYVERNGKRYDADIYSLFKKDYGCFLENLQKY